MTAHQEALAALAELRHGLPDKAPWPPTVGRDAILYRLVQDYTDALELLVDAVQSVENQRGPSDTTRLAARINELLDREFPS